MNQEIINQYASVVASLDHLLQEGVLFTPDEVGSLENLSARAQTIISQLLAK
jgi:hypothetical protein